MNKHSLYTPKTLFLFRFFSLLSIIILLISTSNTILTLGYKTLITNNIELLKILVNIFIIISFIFVIISPSRIEIFSIDCFLYSTFILILEPENAMGILMFFLGTTILYSRGFYNTHRTKKNLISMSILLLLTLTEIRFGKNLFVYYIIQKIGYIFILLLSFFFIKAFIVDLFKTTGDKILNINQYPQLRLRDAKWLSMVQKHEKYETIAIEYHMSIGSVKNRLKTVFNILGTGDRRGFLNEYEEYKIFYDNYEIK